MTVAFYPDDTFCTLYRNLKSPNSRPFITVAKYKIDTIPGYIYVDYTHIPPWLEPVNCLS